MTPSIVEGLKALPDRPPERLDDAPETRTETNHEDPSLSEPAVGNPISHGQIVHLWKTLKTSSHPQSYSLENLLLGSNVYVPPPPPKREPTPEYKALMARLRREEEARAYQRMVSPPHVESFHERFPHASARAFAAVNRPTTADDESDGDVTFDDVQRQVLLIINFLVSILGVAGTIWVLARWWSLPARLFLTMGSAIVVGIAEVSVYSIYVWKVDDGKKKEDAVKEMKEVVETWVVGEEGEKKEEDDEKTVLLESKEEDIDGVRKRTATAREAD